MAWLPLCSLLLLALVAVGHVSCTSPVAKEKGFVGVDAEGNLHVDAPEGGKVFVKGVDVLAALDDAAQSVLRALCDAGVMSFLSVDQSIDTVGAWDLETFEIDGVPFLAVANSNDGVTYNIPSTIHQWNRATKKFEQTQSINTHGAVNWEYFSIGDDHFLAVANHYNDITWKVASVIYQWNSKTNRFEPAQSIDTKGAHNWEHFVIDGIHFLAVANFYDSSTHNIPSVVYRWNSNSKQFQQAQLISTSGARDWEYFVIDDQHFLVVANHKRDGEEYTIPSVIYLWNSFNGQFEPAQTIETNGAWSWKYFTISDVHFLAVANALKNFPSVIYQWNQTSSKFSEIQSVHTDGAHHWEYFTINSAHLLAVANFQWRNNNMSTIYQWNDRINQFEQTHVVNTNGAHDFEAFIVDDVHYLAVANHYNGKSMHTPSVIFQLNPSCI